MQDQRTFDVDPARLLGVRRKHGGAKAYLRTVQRDPCSYCGALYEPWPVDRFGRPYNLREIDHIEPRSQGGANHWSNYTAACGGCNVLKFDYPLLEWLLRLQRLPEDLMQIMVEIEERREVQ